jgi:hypothetical protein
MISSPFARTIALALATSFAAPALGQEASQPPEYTQPDREESFRSNLRIQVIFEVDGKPLPTDFYTDHCDYPVEQVVENLQSLLSAGDKFLSIDSRAAMYSPETGTYESTASIRFSDQMPIDQEPREFARHMVDVLKNIFDFHLNEFLTRTDYTPAPRTVGCNYTS